MCGSTIQLTRVPPAQLVKENADRAILRRRTIIANAWITVIFTFFSARREARSCSFALTTLAACSFRGAHEAVNPDESMVICRIIREYLLREGYKVELIHGEYPRHGLRRLFFWAKRTQGIIWIRVSA